MFIPPASTQAWAENPEAFLRAPYTSAALMSMDLSLERITKAWRKQDMLKTKGCLDAAPTRRAIMRISSFLLASTEVGSAG